jgi:hypothetical protein
VLARLAPLSAPHHDGTIVDGPAARRRRRRRTAFTVVLLLLVLGSGGAVVVLTGAGPRGVAPGLLSAAAAAGVAEVLRRRLGRDVGVVPVTRGGADEPSASPADRPLGDGGPAEAAAPCTGVWSARGAVHRDARHGPPTRCALPPARAAVEVVHPARAGEPQDVTRDETAAHRAEPAGSPPLDDLDLTREVLAALHAGAGDR